jgi:hypothetical protein
VIENHLQDRHNGSNEPDTERSTNVLLREKIYDGKVHEVGHLRNRSSLSRPTFRCRIYRAYHETRVMVTSREAHDI